VAGLEAASLAVYSVYGSDLNPRKAVWFKSAGTDSLCCPESFFPAMPGALNDTNN
jgi:hypothetical protein